MILLDTHTWIWWVAAPEKLSDLASKTIDAAVEEGSVHVSAFSCWEVTMLVSKGRLELNLDVNAWIDRSRDLPFLTFVSVDPHIAVRSLQLPGSLHNDPADRLIVATAITLGARLVTRDQKLHDYPHVDTIW